MLRVHVYSGITMTVLPLYLKMLLENSNVQWYCHHCQWRHFYILSVIIIIKHCYNVITNIDFILTYLMVTVLAMFGNLYVLDTLGRN